MTDLAEVGGFLLLGVTLAVSWFSWELEGSMASLLGTGVTTAGFLLLFSWSELDFVVVSWRQDGRGVVEVGVAVVDLEGALGEDLAKKPRMLCCLRVAVEDEAEAEADPGFLDIEAVFAGVRVSPILGRLSPRRGGFGLFSQKKLNK